MKTRIFYVVMALVLTVALAVPLVGPAPVLAADTGWTDPANNAPGDGIGGGGNGFEVTPQNAYTDGGGNAANINGNGNSHRYYGYDFSSIPAGSTIDGIAVRLDWWLSSKCKMNRIYVDLSWDGGLTWTSTKTASNERISDGNPTDIEGGPVDDWNHSWDLAAGELSASNFVVRLKSACSYESFWCADDCSKKDWFLDWVPVRVCYTLPPGYISLTPDTDTNCVGGNHTVTATIVGDSGGTTVTFNVTAGPNSGDTGNDTTDLSGMASWTYTGDGGAGTDTIVASYTPNPTPGGPITSDPVSKTWVADPGPPTTQLVMMLDGSGSIDATEWSTMINGLAAAVNSSECVPADGSVELTVIQFATNARLEVGPVVIDDTDGDPTNDASAIAGLIESITKYTGDGWTCIACAIYLAQDVLLYHSESNFNICRKQALNLVTDGDPNRRANIDGGTGSGWVWLNSGSSNAKNSAVNARNYAIAQLGMTEDQDELDAEGVGITTANKNWLRDSIVWPQPGYEDWLPTGPGWVHVVDTFQEFADTICEKIQIILEPTGACCNPATGTCEDELTEAECQHEWTEDKSCADIVCEAPPDELDFGDAPEGGEAYPSSGVMGQFPTCKTVGMPLNWIQHGLGWAHFGTAWDAEPDGDAGLCPPPGCFPTYDDDECYLDGDAGLIVPEPYTINATTGAVVTCPQSAGTPLGLTCQTATWGTDVDIFVVNNMPNEAVGYVNVLMDWNQDGQWAFNGSTTCAAVPVPEHVLVNQLIPAGYIGPLSGVPGGVPNFQIGPNPGYVWTRFTISEREVPLGIKNFNTHNSGLQVLPDGWHGAGEFEDGETEDYLLRIDEALPEMTIDKDVVGVAPVGVAPGGTVQYTINVTNSGIGTAINVSIWDALGTYFTYASTDDISYTGGAGYSGAPEDDFSDPSQPTWKKFIIPSGDSVVITFTAAVDSNIPVGTYQNTAYADGDNFTQIDDLGPFGQDADTPPLADPEVDENVFVAEEPPPQVTGVPTLTQWGMIAMGILFAAFLIWTVRRRWVVSADGRQE